LFLYCIILYYYLCDFGLLIGYLFCSVFALYRNRNRGEQLRENAACRLHVPQTNRTNRSNSQRRRNTQPPKINIYMGILYIRRAGRSPSGNWLE